MSTGSSHPPTDHLAILTLLYDLYLNPKTSVDYVCSQLAALPDDDIEFYLPQLTHQVVYSPGKYRKIERFLAYVSSRSLHLALQMSWLFQAEAEGAHAARHSAVASRCLDLLNQIRLATIQQVPGPLSFHDGIDDDDDDDDGYGTAFNTDDEDGWIGPGSVRSGSARSSEAADTPGSPRPRKQRVVASRPRRPALSRCNSAPDCLELSAIPGIAKAEPSTPLSPPMTHETRRPVLTTAPVPGPVVNVSIEVTEAPGSGGGIGSGRRHRAHRSLAPDMVSQSHGGFLGRSLMKRPGYDDDDTDTDHDDDEQGAADDDDGEAAALANGTTTASSGNSDTDDVPAVSGRYARQGKSPRGTDGDRTPITDEDRERLLLEKQSLLRDKLCRFDFLTNEMQYVTDLLAISTRLIGVRRSKRRQRLVRELVRVNDRLGTGVYLPLCWSSDSHHQVIRVCPNESANLNSKTRVPYVVYVEVLARQDTVSSFTVRRVNSVPDFIRALKADGDQEPNVAEDVPGSPSKTEWWNRMKRPEWMLQTDIDGVTFGDQGSMEEVLTNLVEADRNRSFSHVKFSRQIQRRMSIIFRDHDPQEDQITATDLISTPFGELWAMREQRIRAASPFGHLPNWKLMSMIVKTNDDLRQEQLAVQMIALCNSIFQKENLPLWLRPFRIIITSSSSGLLEVIRDCVSIHGLKKALPYGTKLDKYFEQTYKGQTDGKLRLARRNFAESLAAYSLVCYLLQLKDRHNGNILLDFSGHIIHIDFGFILGLSPGSFGFEKAPFKFNDEYLAVLGGEESDLFNYFVVLFVRGFLTLRKHVDLIVLLAEMMTKGSQLPCFAYRPKRTLADLRNRLVPNATEADAVAHAVHLIRLSMQSWSTGQYDVYQYLTNGTLY